MLICPFGLRTNTWKIIPIIPITSFSMGHCFLGQFMLVISVEVATPPLATKPKLLHCPVRILEGWF